MATGIMSLAYLGELGVVFNLAYIELKKTRYVDNITRNIENTKKIVQPVMVPGNPTSFKSQTQLAIQLDEMLDRSRAVRKKAWVCHKANDSEHFDFYSGAIYDFFDHEIDKVITQVLLIIAGLLVLAITILEIFPTFSTFKNCHVYVYSIFWLLLISNLVPLFFVILGRLMTKTANKCTKSVQQRFTETTGNAMQVATKV